MAMAPAGWIGAGIGLLTEDRKLQGLILGHSVRENFGLPNLDWLTANGFVKLRRERESTRDSRASSTSRPPGTQTANSA